MAYASIDQTFSEGGLVILDGATGTELQRRGVAMEPTAWCGAIGIESGAVLEAIHRDYIDAGARIVTSNTFATSRMILKRAGLEDHFAEINQLAIGAAQAARGDRIDVAIAGSLSHMIPRRDLHGETSDQEIIDSYQELAAFLAGAGCDVILLEMMFAPERMHFAFEAAKATGLPVWAGFSVKRSPDGGVRSFHHNKTIPFAEITPILRKYEVQAAGIMHSESEVTGDALAILRKDFDGPLTAYPDSGHMKMPDWQFEEIIPVEDFTDYARDWRAQGVQGIGGCCGLGLDHIAALRDL